MESREEKRVLEAMLVESFLAEPVDDVEVPAAGLVYWKAELRARREQGERAMRPMRAMELMAMVMLCVVAVGLGVMAGSLVMPLIGVAFALTLAVLGWVVKTYLVRDGQSNSTRSMARNS